MAIYLLQNWCILCAEEELAMEKFAQVVESGATELSKGDRVGIFFLFLPLLSHKSVLVLGSQS